MQNGAHAGSSDAMLEKLAELYLRQSLGTDDPAAIEAARKQLEAAVEVEAEVAEEKPAVETQPT